MKEAQILEKGAFEYIRLKDKTDGLESENAGLKIKNIEEKYCILKTE